MPDYNSAFTGAQIDARLTLAGTAQQPPAEGPFVDGDKTKLDGIDTTNATINDHIADDANPHGVTKAQVGLSNVDNTSDADKPISTAQAAEFDAIDAATTAVATRTTALEDLVSAGAVRKEAVAVATTANITLSGEQTIDGTLTSASRILVKDQSTAAQNGIYVTGAGSWARATDMDAAGEVQGALVYVNGGTTNAGRSYYTSSEVTTLDTDAIAWQLDRSQSGLQTQINAIDAYLVDPFPKSDFGVSASFIGDHRVAPTSGVTDTAAAISIANAGRFYPRAAIAFFGMSIGDTVRAAFRKTSGSDQPATFRFLDASNVLVDAAAFTLRGGWYVAEAVIPATTTKFNIDYTNSTGGAVVITRPRISKRVASGASLVAERARVDSLFTETQSVSQIWPGAATVATTAGSGTATINSGDTVTIPAGANVEVKPTNGLIVRDVTDVMTVTARVSSPNVRNLKFKVVGSVSGTTSYEMVPIAFDTATGETLWRWSGVVAVAAQTTISNAYIVIDNRSPVVSTYTAADVTLSDVVLVDGAETPSKIPSAETDTFPDGEMVLTQDTGIVYIHQRAGASGKYIRWTFSRYDNAATRALGWRLTGLATATRSGDATFSVDKVLTDSGEFELAIQEVGKTDFMGGLTHGDQEETQTLLFKVDGNFITPDGSTTYYCRRAEAFQLSSLWEVDNVSDVLTATVATGWGWFSGEMTLLNRVAWARSINVSKVFLAMMPAYRYSGGGASGTLLTSDVYKGPTFISEDISSPSHTMSKGNFPRLITSGDASVTIDMEVVDGFETTSRSFVGATTSNRNKIYFDAINTDVSTAVTSGDVINFKTVYKIGVS